LDDQPLVHLGPQELHLVGLAGEEVSPVEGLVGHMDLLAEMDSSVEHMVEVNTLDLAEIEVLLVEVQQVVDIEIGHMMAGLAANLLVEVDTLDLAEIEIGHMVAGLAANLLEEHTPEVDFADIGVGHTDLLVVDTPVFLTGLQELDLVVVDIPVSVSAANFPMWIAQVLGHIPP
jgi:hypothetical protein